MIKPDHRRRLLPYLLILAGFIVGTVARDRLPGRERTAAGIVVALIVWMADRKGRR